MLEWGQLYLERPRREQLEIVFGHEPLLLSEKAASEDEEAAEARAVAALYMQVGLIPPKVKATERKKGEVKEARESEWYAAAAADIDDLNAYAAAWQGKGGKPSSYVNGVYVCGNQGESKMRWGTANSDKSTYPLPS